MEQVETRCKGIVSLYRFYNWEKGRHGEPFALCEAHFEKQPTPSGCILQKLADNSLISCSSHRK